MSTFAPLSLRTFAVGYQRCACICRDPGGWEALCVGAQAAAAPLLRFHSPDADLAIVNSSLGISEGGHSSKFRSMFEFHV